MLFLRIVPSLAFGCRGPSLLKNCNWLLRGFPRIPHGCSQVHVGRTAALHNCRALSTLPGTQTVSKPVDHHSHNFTLIYTFPAIKVLRVISRLKLFQTGITFLLLPPVHYLYFQGQVTYNLMCYSTGIAVFAAIMLYSLSHYLRRFVGMMYLDDSKTTLKVSHLTFWGYRHDIYLPVSDVMTLGDTGDSRNEPLLRLKRYSCPDTLYFSTRLGRVVDKQAFEMVFGSFS
ncbi:transmembrane protein 186 [Megalops cyprinoides]|uniref:transmembrane protein 186 n=1 Tax=Megalops cyprinoides TaxID=118141 RepID=UPI001863F4BE|nr:transmembrane protein 186 [Megalops cyprinoides]